MLLLFFASGREIKFSSEEQVKLLKLACCSKEDRVAKICSPGSIIMKLSNLADTVANISAAQKIDALHRAIDLRLRQFRIGLTVQAKPLEPSSTSNRNVIYSNAVNAMLLTDLEPVILFVFRCFSLRLFSARKQKVLPKLD